MKNILVTGGAGFIGSHLCEALLERGHNVTCLDNFSTGTHENVAQMAALNVVEGDVNNSETWRSMANMDFDVIYHYAATVGVKRTQENASLVFDDVQGILHVARMAKQWKSQVIYSSSSEVYGDPKTLPSREDEDVYGWSPYTIVKLFGEQVFSSLWREQSIPTVSLRFFNVYGKRQRSGNYGFVVAKFLAKVELGQAPSVYGQGEQTRDFVYIEDNIKAAIAVINNKKISGQIINVGSGVETSIKELALWAIKIGGLTGQMKPQHLAQRPDEINRRCASVKKQIALLGAACDTSLTDGMLKTIAEKPVAINNIAFALEK